jgi:hypothetical protein
MCQILMFHPQNFRCYSKFPNLIFVLKFWHFFVNFQLFEVTKFTLQGTPPRTCDFLSVLEDKTCPKSSCRGNPLIPLHISYCVFHFHLNAFFYVIFGAFTILCYATLIVSVFYFCVFQKYVHRKSVGRRLLLEYIDETTQKEECSFTFPLFDNNSLFKI